MTFASEGYMPLDRQLFGRTIAESLAELLTQRYRTAKELARAVDIDPSTAENLRKGHLSVTTLQKVMSVEGRSLWDKLGDELFGETFYQFEERRLAATIREAEHARSNLVRLRARREELLSGSSLVDATALGHAPDAAGRAGHGEGPQADRDRDHAPAIQGHRDSARRVDSAVPLRLRREP